MGEKSLQTRELFSSILNSTPFGIVAIDLSGYVSFINDLAIQYLDLKPMPYSERQYNIVDYTSHIPYLQQQIRYYLDNTNSAINIEAMAHNDKYFSIKGREIINGYVITIENITTIKELEANSIQAILEGQENERRRLGREIHDGAGPLLSSAKLCLEAFYDEVQHLEHKINIEQLDNARNMIDNITEDLRSLTHHLMPRLLDEFGLKSAFENLIIRLNKTGRSSIKFYCNFDKSIRFEKEIELNLYRCGQELLNNALKHAMAKEILVQIIKHEESIVLMVEDDGIGFDRSKLLPEIYGIGLTNIDTRVRIHDGEFLLESSKEKGTSASIEVPI